jgi:hypothetical protein
MSNRVTDTIAAAAVANNFKSSAVRDVEKQQPSKADVLGLGPPAVSTEQKAGLKAEATLAGNRLQSKLAAQERYRKEQADFAKARDDAIWQQIRERQRAAIG